MSRLASDALGSQPNEILFERVDVATAADGARLHAAGVLYAPDYVINAGGIISVGREYLGGASAASIEAGIRKIPERLT